MPIRFDGQRAYDHVEKMSVDIGPRLSGSEADRKTGGYIRHYFESLGLPVQEQEFEVETGELLDHRLEVLEPVLGVIPSRPILLTPDTPPDGIEAEMVFVEGTDAPQVGPHLQGKAVLWSASQEFLFIGIKKLLRHKPAALLCVFPSPGVKPKQFHLPLNKVEPFDRIPTFMLTYEDGLRLMQRKAKKVRLMQKSAVRNATTSNIIAEVKGREHPDEIVVIGGHRDTTPDLPGATDDASGTAVVMELARLYAQRGSKRTIRFAAWGAEEYGLVGSRHYCRDLKRKEEQEKAASTYVKGRDKTELEQHMLGISLDVVAMTVGTHFCATLAPADMVASVKILSKELGIPMDTGELAYATDHEPFAWVGIPGLAFGRQGGATTYMHGPEDGIELLDAQHLEEVGRYWDVFLTRSAAEAANWPFSREVPESAAKIAREEMERRGEKMEEKV